jgi:hypothetical protein
MASHDRRAAVLASTVVNGIDFVEIYRPDHASRRSTMMSWRQALTFKPAPPPDSNAAGRRQDRGLSPSIVSF